MGATEIKIFAGIILLEVLIVFVIAAYFYFKNKSPKQNSENDQGASLEELLEKEIMNTQYKAKSLARETAEEEQHYVACMTRIRILENEKKIITEGYTDSETYWELIGEYSSLFDENKNQELQTLRKRLDSSSERIKTLEKFRDMFIEIKNKWEQSRETIEKLSELIRGERDNIKQDSEHVDEALENAQNITDDLDASMKQVEEEFKMILSTLDATQQSDAQQGSDTQLDLHESSKKIANGVINLQSTIKAQSDKIKDLMDAINSLEIESKQAELLLEHAQTLNDKNNELTNILYILEEDNRFLQKQVQELIQGEMVTEKEFTDRLNKLVKDLTNKESEYAELEEKFTKIEGLYLEACEKLEKR